MRACVQLEEEKHRNHFLSSHIITSIFVMSSAFEAILSKMMAYKQVVIGGFPFW